MSLAILAVGRSLAPVPAACAEPGPDTLRLRFELGAASGYTNEFHYQDAFVDTTFLGRQRISDPELDRAAVLSAVLVGSRAMGATRYELRHDLSLGDRLQRMQSGASWSLAPAPDWRLSVAPRGEFRHDQTLGRDLEEWRAACGVRATRRTELAAPAFEAGLGAEWLSARGGGSEFVLDRRAARASAALERVSLTGWDWRLGYAVAARSFPDSTVRDHIEHTADARLRIPSAGAGELHLEVEATRRAALGLAPTSRDRYWEGRAAVEFASGEGGGLAFRGRVEGEATRYDEEDSTLYFGYQVARARLGPRIGSGMATVWLGPAAEILTSRLAPGEGYQELGGFLEIEWIPAHGWWSVTPSAGWRDYDETEGAPLGLSSLHASYAFIGIVAIADQALPSALRLRVLADGRWESHVDHTQDGGSLYFSVDVRRLF